MQTRVKKQIINFEKFLDILKYSAKYIQKMCDGEDAGTNNFYKISAISALDNNSISISFSATNKNNILLDNITEKYHYNYSKCCFEDNDNFQDSSLVKQYSTICFFKKTLIEITWPFENIKDLANMFNCNKNKVILEFDSNSKMSGYLSVVNLMIEDSYKVSTKARNSYYDLNHNNELKFLKLSSIFNSQTHAENNTIFIHGGGSFCFYELTPVNFEEAIIER